MAKFRSSYESCENCIEENEKDCKDCIYKDCYMCQPEVYSTAVCKECWSIYKRDQEKAYLRYLKYLGLKENRE